MTKTYSLPTDKTREARKKLVDRDHYRWYHEYLSPIPTLFNAQLGDRLPSASSADGTPVGQVEEVPKAEEAVFAYSDFVVSPEQFDAVMAMLEGELTEDSVDKAVGAFLPFALEGSSSSNDEAPPSLDSSPGGGGTRKAQDKAYDETTGVPAAEFPGDEAYWDPRQRFLFFNEIVLTKLKLSPKPLTTPNDYKQIYDAFRSRVLFAKSRKCKVMGIPNLHEVYTRNDFFGWQRLAGANPRVLELLTADRSERAVLTKMKLEDHHIKPVAGPTSTLEGELAAQRLYVCDYWLLDKRPLQKGRYMAAAIGVFWSDVANKKLLPVAIQLSQTPDSIIYTPRHLDWDYAKLAFSVADFNYHEMGTHLCEGHFAQEAFAIATCRNLPAQHPLGALLREVYWALLFNNALGRQALVNEKGYVDRMMPGELVDGSLAIVRDFYDKVWRWDDWNLEAYLRKKGTDNSDALPVYPYRDDGLPLWRAIKKFAVAFVGAYYGDDVDVAGDTELQSWRRELIAPDMGRLTTKGFPEEISTKAALSEVLARLIWQAGPGHGGINYSQWQHFAVVPNQPGSAYAAPNSVTSSLPPWSQAVDQVSVLNVITQRVFGTLGSYGKSFVAGLNGEAKEAVSVFRASLKACTAHVKRQNETGPRKTWPYVFLDPKNLPNSSNI